MIIKPKYDLQKIKQAFNSEDKLIMTASARQGQYELGFTNKDIVDSIQALSVNDFYKSMPPIHPSFTAWQDVYKPIYKNKALYMKFQINHYGEIIISFKPR